jgi:uncharacterized protein YuzE
MLYQIRNLTDSFSSLLYQDPVRPHIPHTQRIGDSKDIFVLKDDNDNVKAITCVSYQQSIPTTESELFLQEQANTAVFYTIWSYVPGAGRSLIFEAVKYIKENKPEISRFVTLSPKTEMAKRFHHKNGAITFRENQESVNYEYCQ